MQQPYEPLCPGCASAHVKTESGWCTSIYTYECGTVYVHRTGQFKELNCKRRHRTVIDAAYKEFYKQKRKEEAEKEAEYQKQLKYGRKP